ncbi:response regulator transcription factor [Clostridium sp. D2Q-14]|uniref:response regulator transcription factor n=1 Tax=Anaeromonas gelatinilytica TaxID=2683194 RepID=UPI00193C447F|nr:response regulator transcription factor [Anaeromonas gelatinilytica]MBS4536299.1 response regulator transcription factor [Anaeromonas gelatinilytica]
MEYKILVVDDDMDLCRLVKKYLGLEGYDVVVKHDGKSGLVESQINKYHLIILDVMLPKMNGFEVLAEIRKSSSVPVLMLTAKDSEVDKVSGLRIGADDYITKPFSNSEFIARVQSIIRRYMVLNFQSQSEESILTVGNLCIDVSRREVYKNNMLIELTAKEFDLLYFLASNKGKVFTKKQIYRAVWNDEYAFDDNNIMVHIRRLRKKIESTPENPAYILTVWGVGYKFGGNEK